MIFDASGDLLESPHLTHIVHQCNLYHTFGSGLALQIKNKYPMAVNADLQTTRGDLTKLGWYTRALTNDGKVVLNLYSQVGISATQRTTSYDKMFEGLTRVKQALESPGESEWTSKSIHLGIPYKLGCGLAGGSWKIVCAIIGEIFEDAPFHVTIYQRPGDK